MTGIATGMRGKRGILPVCLYCSQPYATVSVGARKEPDILCRFPNPRMTIRTALVTLLAIALFAWFLSRANLSGIAAEIAHARMDLIVWSVVIAALMPVLRALRWQYLLDPVGPTRFGPVLRATIIGFAALALLPARAGDVIRPYLVARSEQLIAASVFATIVMERSLDIIVVLTLLASFVWLFDGRAILPAAVLAPIQASATLAGGIVIVLMVVMWTLATHPERIERLVASSDRVRPVVSPLGEHCVSGMARDPCLWNCNSYGRELSGSGDARHRCRGADAGRGRKFSRSVSDCRYDVL